MLQIFDTNAITQPLTISYCSNDHLWSVDHRFGTTAIEETTRYDNREEEPALQNCFSKFGGETENDREV